MGEWINIFCYIHKKGYYLATEENEQLMYTATCDIF